MQITPPNEVVDMYEITFINSMQTYNWTRKECNEFFGKDEFAEVLAGYLPDVVAVKIR